MAYTADSKWKAISASLSRRQKFAVALWVLCLLGSFLPTSSSVLVYPIILGVRISPPASMVARLIGISIPLAMVLIGARLTDSGETLDMATSPILKPVFGAVIEWFGWVQLALMLGLFLFAPLLLMLS